jgi:hypothetical protein
LGGLHVALPVVVVHYRHHHHQVFVARAGDEDPGLVSEELMARLRAAEEEARELKQRLDAVQQGGPVESDAATPGARRGNRIDGADLRRETLSFVDDAPRNWLSESDIEFFTGGGPSEAEGDGGATATSAAATSAAATATASGDIVRRRVLLGLGLSVAVGAFALVPTEQLQAPPSKPLFFYLVPLLRVRALLDDVLTAAADGDYERLERLVASIEGPPNNVQQNLKAASASLLGVDARLAQRADSVGRDAYEYLKGVDFQTYFESRIGGTGPSAANGAQTKAFYDYSRSSALAAATKLDEFLRMMPEDQLEAARTAARTAAGSSS